MATPSAVANLPVIDLGKFLAAEDRSAPEIQELCKQVADSLRDTGCLVLRDPRCPSSDNGKFLDMLEQYFEQTDAKKKQDSRPEVFYQVGSTPDGTEVPKCMANPACVAEIEEMPEEHRATKPTGPDAKWRFFHRIGDRPDPSETEFAELNLDAVVPEGFPQWVEVMDMWGYKMLDAVTVAAQMAARGFGLEETEFSSRMAKAPHLLAPTGSDLGKHGKVGTIFAGYHYDLNFLTIHGKSRFPGLFVWLRDGRKVAVKVPDDCLLVQAGIQLEHITGGYVKAGMHEVVCTDATVAAVDAAKAAGRSVWRVSSTVFGHLASDAVLEPIGAFATEEAKAKYCSMKVGEQVRKELEAISLAQQK
jgi:isopenicillin N synthase-like dioxygenase